MGQKCRLTKPALILMMLSPYVIIWDESNSKELLRFLIFRLFFKNINTISNQLDWSAIEKWTEFLSIEYWISKKTAHYYLSIQMSNSIQSLIMYLFCFLWISKFYPTVQYAPLLASLEINITTWLVMCTLAKAFGYSFGFSDFVIARISGTFKKYFIPTCY